MFGLGVIEIKILIISEMHSQFTIQLQWMLLVDDDDDRICEDRVFSETEKSSTHFNEMGGSIDWFSTLTEKQL